MKHDYLLLGEVVRPQGIHGEVKLRHYTDDPERFLDLTTVYREREAKEKERHACRMEQLAKEVIH